MTLQPKRILIFHTAFLGDIVLTLPLAQALRERFPDSRICFVAIPAAAAVFGEHPAIDEVILYDKKGSQKGLGALLRLAGRIRRGTFDVALVPHRSLRSALVVRLAGIPVRIGFDTSAGRFLFTDVVPDRRDLHEILRNLSLGEPLGLVREMRLPELFPSKEDIRAAEEVLAPLERTGGSPLVSVAPGSVWNTKRWLEESFTRLVSLLAEGGIRVVLVGGPGDSELCNRIAGAVASPLVVSGAGKLSVLQSAEVIHRSNALLTNDSAPMHLGVAMKTPVTALFGATVPEFGFAPVGPLHTVLQTGGLSCRPCSRHGGERCPIGTFECMTSIVPSTVFESLMKHVPVPQSQ